MNDSDFSSPPPQLIPMLKALADANRLRIFNVLMQGDSCNCELNEALGLANNLLSHHLNVLRIAGLIEARRDSVDGRWIYYAVNQDTLTLCRDWLNGFLNPDRLNPRPTLCGPEGQQELVNDYSIPSHT